MAGIVDQLLDPATVLLHDPVVDLLAVAEVLLDRHALPPGWVVDGGVVVRPAVVGLIHVDGPAQHDRLEVVHPGLLPAGLEPLGEVGVGRSVAPHADGRRRALEHVEVLGRLGQRRHALDAGRAGADERHDLVAQLRSAARPGHRRCSRSPIAPCGTTARRTSSMPGMAGSLSRFRMPDRQHVVAAGRARRPGRC